MAGIDPAYVDVAERLREFHAKFPEGRVTEARPPVFKEIGNRLFIIYTAKALRTPDDPTPAIGTAWEPFPGPTPFTRDSELQNAETAAWGRAIIAAGIPSKKVASHEEVRNRQEPSKPATKKAEPKPDVIPAEAVTVLWGQVTGLIDSGSVDANKVRTMLTAVGVKDAKTIKTALEAMTPAQAKAFQAQLDSTQAPEAAAA